MTSQKRQKSIYTGSEGLQEPELQEKSYPCYLMKTMITSGAYWMTGQSPYKKLSCPSLKGLRSFRLPATAETGRDTRGIKEADMEAPKGALTEVLKEEDLAAGKERGSPKEEATEKEANHPAAMDTGAAGQDTGTAAQDPILEEAVITEQDNLPESG